VTAFQNKFASLGFFEITDSPGVQDGIRFDACKFIENSAGSETIGIFDPVDVVITDSIFQGNTGKRGGGLAAACSGLSISRSTFSNNNAEDFGGGGYLTVDKLEITDSVFSNNVAGLTSLLLLPPLSSSVPLIGSL